MAEENQQSKEKEENQLQQPTPLITNNESDKKVNSESGSNDASKKSQPGLDLPQPFIIKVEKEKKKWINTQQIIPIFALLISITAVVLNKCSLDNTSKALAINDSTFKRNVIKDSLTFVSNHRRDSLDSIRKEQDFKRDTTNIGLSKNSLETQIKSIKETQKQFELANEPFLEIDSIVIHKKVGQPLSVDFQINNLNNYTAKIVGAGQGISTKYNPPDLKSVKDAITSIGDNSHYITSTRPVHMEFSEAPKIFDKRREEYFNSGKFYIYFGVIIVYENMVTGKKKLYKFLGRIKSDGSYEYLIDDNVYLDDERVKPAFFFRN